MGKENCELCNTNKDEIVYEDEKAIALLERKVAAPGHMRIFPKEHYLIMEETPDDDISHAFSIANRMSVIAFEALGAKGTNILINNGVAAGQKHAHLSINVIPRQEGDNVGLMWTPKPADDAALSEVEEKIKAALLEAENAPTKEAPSEEGKPGEEKPKIKNGEEENYLIRQLRRLP